MAKNWIQGVVKDMKKRGTEGDCTGDKFGSESCPPHSRKWNLAKLFRRMAKKRDASITTAAERK